MFVIDCEVYKNYFLLAAKNIISGEIKTFEMTPKPQFKRGDMAAFLSNNTTISFNGLNYDLPIIWAVLKTKSVTTQTIKDMSDDIIQGRLPGYRVLRERGLPELPVWDHIDLIEVAPGQSSLKIYGARLAMARLQDLPYHEGAELTEEQMQEVKAYCLNDLDLTQSLYKRLEKQIALRAEMGKTYGMDLRSKSDAQIAEAVIVHELSLDRNKRTNAPETVRYQDPKIITFEGVDLRGIFERLLGEKFSIGGNGAVIMPDWLKSQRIVIGQTEYNMGIGGLHSCEKNQIVRADTGMMLADFDVASYYPSIILQQRLAPKSLGKKFLSVYQSLVNRRLEAKRSGDKTTADTLKICVNGSFGKLGSKYSALYSPDLMIQVTLTGQLALLMLIEQFESAGIRVVSANTDGVVVHTARANNERVENIAFDWLLRTSYELERTDYRMVVSRDVNNYLAVKTDGEIKRKGCFTPAGIAKNPDREIVYTAVCEHFANGTPVRQTVEGCNDLSQFVMVRTVKGGALFDGEYVGKAVRWYYSRNGADLRYKLNNNLVPNSSHCRPAMTLGPVPDDLDYDRYINDAEEMIKELGC
jgi:hypothetical protein